jgi:nicotinamidase-related amidase
MADKPPYRGERALLVVDALNEFVYGDIRGEDPERIIPNLGRLLTGARKNAVPVVYCCDEHLPPDHELAIWGPHAMKGSKEAQVIDALRPGKGDYVVPKRTYSGFHETGLDSLLRDLGVETVYVTGFYADPCVRHTVSDAYARGYGVVVVADAVDALDAAEHGRQMDYMQLMYGARLVDAAQVLDEIIG